jgi:hypothetical protein
MNADNTKCLNAYPRLSAFIGGPMIFGATESFRREEQEHASPATFPLSAM